MVALKWKLGLLGSLIVLLSVTQSEGLLFAFSAESFCAAQADGWAFFSLGNGHGLCPHLVGRKSVTVLSIVHVKY